MITENTIMKRLLKVSMVILICFSMFGCTNQKKEEPSIVITDAQNNNNSNNNNNENKDNNTEKPEVVSTGFSGTYYSNTDEASDPYYPTVTFNKDGTFSFIENCYAGMIESSGTYTVNDKQIDCVLTQNNMQGFKGDDVKEITFIKDGNSLIIMNEICMTKKLDVFTVEKKVVGNTEIYGAGPDFTEYYYVCDNELSVDGYEPRLILRDDNSFTFEENTFHGMAYIHGTFTSDRNGTLTCKVTDSDDIYVEELVFTMGDGYYELQNDLIMSVKGNRFEYVGDSHGN